MLLDLFYLDRSIWNGDFTTFAISMPAAQGAYALTGQDATLIHPITFVADVGSFALNGQTATFDVKVSLAQGSYSLNGQAVNFDVKIPIGQGSFALNGQDATLTVFIPSVGLTLAADTGLFTLIGENDTFGISVPLAQGSYALNGQTITFNVKLPADQGSFTFTGEGAGLVYSGAAAVAPPLRDRRKYRRTSA